MDDLSKKSFDYKTLHGPSFKEGVPDADAWLKFKKSVNHEKAQQICDLWYQKAVEAQGVPDRSALSFEELVPFGRNIYMAKLVENNQWDTTYCGSEIVSNVGVEATGKSLDVFAKPETLKFWMDNLDKMLVEHHVYWEFYTLEFANKEYMHCCSITFPLKSSDSDVPDVQFVYEVYTAENLTPDHL